MIPSGVSVYMATVPVDLRGGFDRLSGVVSQQLRNDPRAGDLYVFMNKRRTHLKALFYDSTGYCILYKRLDRGAFPMPVVVEPGASSVAVSAEELALILRGLSVGHPRPPPTPKKKTLPIVH